MPTVLLVKQLESGDSEEKEFEVELNQVIFEQLDEQGETLPHGCLAGSCGSCRIEVLEGAENLAPPSAVEKDTIKTLSETYQEKYGPDFLKERTLRLSCRARINGNVKIKPLKA